MIHEYKRTPVTGCGVFTATVLPFPIWPSELFPQQYAWFPVVMPQV